MRKVKSRVREQRASMVHNNVAKWEVSKLLFAIDVTLAADSRKRLQNLIT